VRNAEQRLRLIAILAIASALARIAWAAEQNVPVEGSVVRFAITPGVLEADVNPDDALVAARIWSASLGTAAGIWAKSDARIFHDLSSLVASVKSGDVDILSLSTKEYLEIENTLRAEPMLTNVQSGQVELEYIILARQDSGIKTPADLRGKRITLPKGGRNSMMPLWLDAFLVDNGLPVKETFFKEIREVAKTSQVVLPIFFGQVDVGVVIRTAFDTAVTLNPQIGQQLRIIAISPRLVPMVTCFRTTLQAERKALYFNQAPNCMTLPAGCKPSTFSSSNDWFGGSRDTWRE
jgi:ABC-type phosphate/phosphonate transport system substrate-binding protein